MKRVFVSAVTRELGTIRRVAAMALARSDHIKPIVDETSPPGDFRQIAEFLHGRIQKCDAVVCLIGFGFGVAPSDRPDRSYTQIEFDIATTSRPPKPTWVFLASEEFRNGQRLC